MNAELSGEILVTGTEIPRGGGGQGFIPNATLSLPK